MSSWSKAPFVRILIPFVAGLLIYRSGWSDLSYSLIAASVLALLIALAAWLFMFPSLNTYRVKNIQGSLILLCIVACGWLVSYNSDYRNNNDFIGNLPKDSMVEMILKTDNAVEQKNSNLKTTASVIAFKTDSGWTPCSGRILLYISNPDSAATLGYGDIIAARFYLNEVQNPLFNSDFNYKKYLAGKNIFHQAYIGDEQFTVLKTDAGNPLMSFTLGIRGKMVDILQNQLGENDESAVISAMLAGYRADISADMMKAYSQAGVIHIMSVSGLHVGVIYIMITAFIGLFGWFKKKKWINVALVLSLIWFYALLTGLSASVLRSAVMISFVVIGSAMQRSTSPYNSLAAAAFILLAFNPASISEIGFQLSFTAVLGILLFQRPLYNLWHIRNKWLDKIWQLACVSMAAQLMTLPFILYYFGQFPVYFLISNLIVVPLSSFVLYAGMAAVLLSWIPYLGTAVSFIALWLTKGMNFVVTTIELLPGAVISNIFISAWPAVILVLVVGLLYLMYYRRKVRLLYPVLLLAIVASLFEWQNKYSFDKQKEVFFIKDGGEFITGIKQNKSVYLILPDDSTVVSDYLASRLDRYAGHNSLQIITVPQVFNSEGVFRHESFLAWNQYRMLNWSGRKMPEPAENFPDIDLLLAPNLGRYYFEKYDGQLPADRVLSKIRSDNAGMFYIGGKKEWKFRVVSSE